MRKMVPCEYIDAGGNTVKFDLDAVTDIVAGFSKSRSTWTATLIYVLKTHAFVELRSSPQDVHGDSEDEAEEVSTDYIRETFGISEMELARIKSNPKGWRFIDQRKHA